MSVNAQMCPHCGEFEFFRRHDRQVWEEEPCDYAVSDEEGRCKGRGYYYRYMKQVDLDRDHRDPDAFKVSGYRLSVPREDRGNRELMEAIRRGDYVLVLSGLRDLFYWIYYQKRTCPRCGGTGKIRTEHTEYDWEDIRRPVDE